MTGSTEPMAVARIRDAAGRLAGSGFLVAPDLVLTCTHVLLAAMRTTFTDEPPDDLIDLDFPVPGGDERLRARVLAWTAPGTPGRGDTALLQLTAAPPASLTAARLRPAAAVWDEPMRIFGYALRRPEALGDSVAGVVVNTRGSGWLQLRVDDGDPPVEAGFSGSPVWSKASGAVVGMVVSVITGTRTVNAVPVDNLFRDFPRLGVPDPAEVSPYRGLEPFGEDHAAHFRGREALTARLTTQIRDRGLLLLLGPSGSGKSSVLRAGVVPALRAEGTRAATARLEPGEPVDDLLDRLVAPFLPSDGGRAGLDDAAGDGRILLIVDQLEEADPAAVQETLVKLGGLVRAARRRADGTARVMAAVTLRAATLEQVTNAEVADVVRDAAIELVPPMSDDELRAAVTAGDVAFESGLPERIVADAADEPGRLPLVEFALEQLWLRRDRNTLTLAAYQELGRVSGALGRHAGQVLQRMDPAGRERARQVLTSMASPSEDGTGFRRRRLDLTGMDAAQRAVVEYLAARRLVVIAGAEGRPEYAEPAHQALLESWPELAGWLAEDREFLAWHLQLDADRRRWIGEGRDQGVLLRGNALNTARHWAYTRPERLSDAEAEFVTASGHSERRRLRLLRGFAAVVSVLALIAGTFAVVAVQRSSQVSAQLRATASRQLAAHAQRFRATDPAASLQFAQAAWRTAETSEAYGALLSQYGLLDPVDRVYERLWSGEATQIHASGDGSTAIVTGTDEPVVLTGLTGDDVTRTALTGADRQDEFTLDPTGRMVAAASANGRVILWDLARPDAPRTIAPAGEADVYGPGFMAFSAGGERLLVHRFALDTSDTDLRVWDTGSGAGVRTAVRPSFQNTSRVYFGADPGTMLDYGIDSATLRDLATGRVLRRFSGTSYTVAENGAVLVSCGKDAPIMRIQETATGRLRHSVDAGWCGSLDADAAMRTVYDTGGSELHRGVTMVHTGTATVYRGLLPFDAGAAIGAPSTKMAVADGSGGLVLLGVRQNTLYRIRLVPAAAPEPQDGTWVVTPDGRHAVTARNDGTILLSDTTDGRVVTQVKGRAHNSGVTTLISADSRYLVVAEPGSLATYALPGLTLMHRMTLPRREWDLGGDSAARITLRPSGADRIIVLHQGILTWWEIATGTAVGTPLPISPGETYSQALYGESMISGDRPGHPDQVAVTRQDGTVEIWSLSERHAVGPPLDIGASMNDRGTAYDASGSQLAVHTSDGIVVANLTTGERRPVPTGELSIPLGFIGDGLLVVQLLGSVNTVQIWDVGLGQSVGVVVAPDTKSPWTLTGDVLASPARDAGRVVRLDPQAWFERLCALSARPFTDEEATIIRRDNAPADPPCG
ncbi:WD40 repeat protein/energy-coupling factor transporter ATP-binding protein EcfA2 [Actinoplanes lutulentus]|uniref:nSTAND1 domain-containing NTPase n=1 Tax=Actinoplanes lutulentus TaxID=1287878 RepID=UPI0011B937D0|nr:trypsin-like peptidase domain-containing protein [Actinoplanes lutulentus]MBB2948921.1 WD40 repeat protein/energy-coupling factor transporter ATP-binding protein EcfA2 [Actinoplanes lutulentus]